MGERDEDQGSFITQCLNAVGPNVLFAATECFVSTAGGTTDPKINNVFLVVHGRRGNSDETRDRIH